METLSGPGAADDARGPTGLLARAIAEQAKVMPAKSEITRRDQEPLTQEMFPGVDLDLARKRQIGLTELLENASLRDMIDAGVVGSAVLAEQARSRAPLGTPAPIACRSKADLSATSHSWPVQVDVMGRAPFTGPARLLGIEEGQSISLVAHGELLGWALVGLVRGDRGHTAVMSSKGRLQLTRGTAEWLQSLWGGPEIPPLTLNGPGLEVLAVLCPSAVIGRVLRDAC